MKHPSIAARLALATLAAIALPSFVEGKVARLAIAQNYLCAVRKAIARERVRGLLLEQHALRLRQQAAASDVLHARAVTPAAEAAAARACAS